MSILYRAFDADGRLLYVGITKNFAAREAQHRSTSAWYGEVATWTREEFSHRDDAVAAETAAIAAEHPVHNVTHNRKVEWAGADMAAYFVAELRAEAARQNVNQSELARRSGMKQVNISWKFRGERQFSLGEYLTLCDALGVGITEFAERAASAARRSAA